MTAPEDDAQGARPEGDSGADEGTARGLCDPVGAGAHERRGAGRRDRDEAGEERGALRSDALHAHVPADEADDRDDRRLPQQRGRLGGVRHPQPRSTVGHHADQRGLGRGDGAHGGRQEPRPQRTQYRYGQHREAGFPGQGAHGAGDPGRVRAAPSLNGEGAEGDEQCPVQDAASWAAALLERYEHRDDDGGTAHEDAGHRRFGRALCGEHGEVEADHADGRDERESPPLADREPPQRGGRAPADEGQQKDTGEAVAQELAARVRIVAQDAVGGEGTSDEDTGEGGEQRAPGGGGVHDYDAMNGRGPD